MTEPARDTLTPAEYEAQYRAAYGTLRAVAATEAGWTHADDVVQQAAIVALERLDKFERGTNFAAWMAAVVRGVARNHRRAEQRRAAREQAASADRPDTHAPPPPGAGADFDADLRHALASLEPIQEACLVLKTIMGHSYVEIAQIMGIPEATARSHVYRARRRLSKLLERTDTDERTRERDTSARC